MAAVRTKVTTTGVSTTKAVTSGPALTAVNPRPAAATAVGAAVKTPIASGKSTANANTITPAISSSPNAANSITPDASVSSGAVRKPSAGLTQTPTKAPASAGLLYAPYSLDLMSSFDSGRSDTDNITNSLNVQVRGSAQAGTTVTLYKSDGITVLGKAVADNLGVWTITTDTLGEATYNFIAKANQGNLVSPYSTPLTVVVDRTLTTSNFGLVSEKDTGKSQTDELTRDGLPVITFNGEAGLEVVLKGPNNTTLTANTHYSVVYNSTSKLYTVTLLDAKSGGTAGDPFGDYTSGGTTTGNPAATGDGTYTITATDIAGNSGTVGNFIIDTTAPTPTLFDMTDATDTGASASDEITNNGKPVLVFNAEAGLTIKLIGADDSTELVQNTHYTVSYSGGQYTVTLIDAKSGGTASDPFGTYTSAGATTGNPASTADGVYRLVAVDDAGNEASAGTFTIDTTPPETSAFDMTNATDSGSSDSDEVTNSGLPVLTFTGESGLAIALKGPDNTTLTANTHYTLTYDAATSLYTVTLIDAKSGGTASDPFGDYTSGGAATGNPAATGDGTYTIVATDTGGTKATVGTFVIDTRVPAAPTVDFQTTDDLTPVITGTATLAAGETLTVSVGGETYTVVPVDGAWTLDLETATSQSGNTPVLELGTTYSVTASVTDTAGNVKTESTTGELELSATPVGPISATYYNDYNYFATSPPIDNPAIEVVFSGTVNYGPSAFDETQISWDFDGGDAAGGLRAAEGNELTGQSSGVISQLLFVVNSGQSYQTDIERDPSFAGLSGDTFDFGVGLSTYGGSGTPTTASNDIVVQYRWKITEFTTSGTYKGSMLQDFTGGMLADEIIGSANNNIIIGGGGADKLDGLGGTDTISYADLTDSGTVDWHGSYSHGLISLSGMAINLSGSSISAATIASAMGGTVVLGGGDGVAGADLAAGSAGYLVTDASLSTTDMVRDQLANFENITGSNLADYIVGNSGDNVITGGKGVDVLTGGAGADIFNLTASSAATWTVSGARFYRTINLIGGFRVGDVFTYDNYNPIPDYWGSYEVQPGDTLEDIAAGIAAAIDEGPAIVRSVSDTSIETNHDSGTFNRFMSITAYEPDRILDFTSGTDKLQLSANEINLLLSTITNGQADSFWDLVTTPSTYRPGDTGARVAFLNSSSDFAAGGVGALIYDSSTGILSLDQNGNTSATGGLLANADDDVAIVNLGAGTSLTAADITFII